MSNDSSWLAAYEAQKAAVLQKMNESKTGSKPAPSATRNSVSGTSEFSGLVNIDHVKHLSKSTQVTKIMDNLKKHNNHVSHKPPQQPQTAFKQSALVPKSPAVTKPAQQAANRPPVAISSLLKPPPPPPQQQQQPVSSPSVTGFNTPAVPNPSQSSADYSPTKAWNNSASDTANSPWGNSMTQPASNNSSTQKQIPASGVGQGKKSKKKKKGAQGDGIAITDLFKRVKCDSNRNSGDWAQVRNFYRIYSSLDYSNFLSFFSFTTVEHVSEGLVWIKKVLVVKESSHSKFFGQLCNSST